MPDNTQSFNRYSYCINNPLKYTDPSGEFWWAPIFGLIGGAINVVSKAISGQLHSFSDGFAAFGIGAVAGAIGAVSGGAAFAAAGGAAGGIGGFVAGAAGGAAGGAVSMPIQSAGNAIYFGDSFMSTKSYLSGIAIGGLTGGISNGINASMNGRSFWTGQAAGRQFFNVSTTYQNPIENQYQQNETSTNIASQNTTVTTESKELIHYTTQKNYENIMKTKELLPSIGGKHARYGDGQYLTNLQSENYTAGQISRKLYGVPWNTQKIQYYIKIDVSGLNVINNAPHNYLIPGNSPLDISNRITGSGISIFRIKF